MNNVEENLGQILEKIKRSFRLFEQMFEVSVRSSFFRNPSRSLHSIGSTKFTSFYYPKKISIDEIDGFPLKDNKGFVSIEETYKSINRSVFTKVSHVYRFVTSEHVYNYVHTPTGKTKFAINYNFHFDSDLEYPIDTSSHPLNHFQVLQSHPRFKTEEVAIEDFLMEVRNACFRNDNYEPLQEPIFSLRRAM
jgi:hypothetical protein